MCLCRSRTSWTWFAPAVAMDWTSASWRRMAPATWPSWRNWPPAYVGMSSSAPMARRVRVAGQPREPRPVDRASGRAVNWTFVQPPDLATEGPSWFELVGSTVLPRSGVVTLPLADGVMVATRSDFPLRRAAAARLTVGHANLSTIGVGIDRGTFVVGDYDGRTTRYGGREFAAVLSMLPIYHADVRMWLAWPDDDAGTIRMHANLCEFAAYSGAMVWAPSPGGCAILLDSGDLAAMKQDGTLSQWLAYAPDDTRGWKPRFRTSAEGRLVPVAVHIGPVAGIRRWKRTVSKLSTRPSGR